MVEKFKTNNQENVPNILYVFTDQQWAGAMSCAGNKDVYTPSMDRLASEGVRFENAYCTDPVCSPSRASMFSGLMPHQHGVVKNDIRIKNEHIPNTLENLLIKQGYNCAYAGKWHIGTYRGISKEENKLHPYKVLADLGDSMEKRVPRITNACIDFLNQNNESPFFLVASYDTPHEICGWRDAPESIHPDHFNHCPELPDNFDIPEQEASALREIYMSRHPEQGELDKDGWRKYRWAYYRYIEQVDSAIGKILDTLDKNNLTENTMVVFSSDHGDGMGAHQWLGKCFHYDEVVRVPFIIRYPEKIPAGQVDSDKLLSAGIDFYATALDYANIEIPKQCSGMSLRPENSKNNNWRKEVVTEIWVASFGEGDAWENDPFGRMLCTNQYKYAIYEQGENREQLFDIKNDPGETRSLAEDNRYYEILTDLRKRLLDWCYSTKDEIGIKIFDKITNYPDV